LNATLRVAIGIATAGRRDQMPLTLDTIERLGPKPDRVYICPASDKDFDANSLSRWSMPIEVIKCRKPGLTSQRNQILERCGDADVIVFMDDDYYPAPWYLDRIRLIFSSRPDVVIATGHPLHDGATGPGILPDAALRFLGTYSLPLNEPVVQATYGGYGCNMAIRLEAVRANNIRFDENLPLYGWLEDIDFSRRAAMFGAVVKCDQLNGVHLAVKNGRSPGVRLGYSQFANPIYMMRGGSISVSYAFRHMWRNFASNLVKSVSPEPWVDRRGRLRGNLLALADLLRRRLDPRRVIDLR